MGRLFAGTPWDRPPRCESCGALEADCQCSPEKPEPKRIDPARQTVRLRVEKRSKEKHVTVLRGLDPEGNDMEALALRLKTVCGSGGTVKDDTIELQGEHLEKVEATLAGIGYKTKRGG